MTDGREPDDAPELPLDSDLPGPSRTGARIVPVLLVIAGGAVGTAVREALELLVPPIARFPVATIAINVSGAFVLGLLLEALARRGPDEGRRRGLRLLLGTGLLGGYTTYSTMAVDTATLATSGATAAGVLAALITVLVGAGATWLGIAVAAGRRAA